MVKRRELLMGAAGAATSHSALAADGSNPSRLGAPHSSHANVLDPTYINARWDSRSISFENPTGARGGGGKTYGGRKGHAFHVVAPGEKVILAAITGPGTLRHIWMTVGAWLPEVMRAQRLEIFYDELPYPSVSVPVLDFFGLPHGRLAEYYSDLISINEGRGLNSHIPIPFGRSIRVEYTNESSKHIPFYYQIDYTKEPATDNSSYLHVEFRRENPTVLKRDFVISEGLKGPGRFLGCSIGIRVLEKGRWYGEGEVKIYRDGDQEFPTYCGTGLEDYVGSAYGLGRHYGRYSGSPIQIHVPPPNPNQDPDFVSFYRWHVPDPIMFSNNIRVTIQQIGSAVFPEGHGEEFAAYRSSHQSAGHEWATGVGGGILAIGLYERSDDYCATSFVYCTKPQAVTRYQTDVATRDIGWLSVETKPRPVFPSDDAQDQFNLQLKRQWNE